MSSSDLYQQFREVIAGDAHIVQRGGEQDLDFSVFVRQSAEEGLMFTVELWNLARETWQNINQGDGVRIRLGWEPSPKSTVALGIVEQRRTERVENDTKYIIEGLDYSGGQTSLRYTKTWSNRTPSAIAKDIARDIGLSVGRVQQVEGNLPLGKGKMWTIKDDQPVSYWLDELQKVAERRTGAKWRWQVRGGKFYMEQVGNRLQEAVILSYENTLLSINESDGDTGEDTVEYEFEALVEPNLGEGEVVSVETPDIQGLYSVIDLEFRSDTTNGNHICRGKLAPASQEYSVYFPGEETDVPDAGSIADGAWRLVDQW